MSRVLFLHLGAFVIGWIAGLATCAAATAAYDRIQSRKWQKRMKEEEP